MPKEVKYRDVAKFLRGAGWEILRRRGSHEYWAGPRGEGRLSIVAHGGKVSPGIVGQIIGTVPGAPSTWK